jgi:hypothetical protein
MPGLPFTTPVTDIELWKNILEDLGLPIYNAGPTGSPASPVTMRDVLQLLDYGLYNKSLAVYGDGSDGVCNFIATGSTTVAGATLSSGVYTMTRDIWLANGSIIQPTVVIKTAGFRIFCQGVFTNNGTIQSNGNAGSAATGGAALGYTGTLSSGTVGTAGGTGTTTTAAAGTAQTVNSLGGVGGTGGASTVTVNAGAAGGAVTAPTAVMQLPRSLDLAVIGKLQNTTAFLAMGAGSGGGSGGGDGTYYGGGGGGGGGIVVVVAQNINGTGSIQANGGAGGAGGTNGAATCGGGGGGGGGMVIVVSASVIPVATYSSGPIVPGQAITANGGAGGAASPAGGVAGNSVTASLPGTVILLPA